jgi:hypothetical protein
VRTILLSAALISTAACATVPPDESEPERRMPAGECNADGAQAYLGEKATAALGARLLTETGARVLRWVPPRTAVTMDFRPDRLTVSYDDDYVIGRISCG